MTREQYNELESIYLNNPKLTFQNVGYEYVKDLSESDKAAVKRMSEILSKHVKGFSKFNNFKLDKAKEVVLRFQYNWTADEEKPSIPYTGVGYIYMDELLNGFRDKSQIISNDCTNNTQS